MKWSDVGDIAAAACMMTGAVLCLLAGIGLLRLPDVLARMHAGTKTQAFGLLLILIGVALRLRGGAALGTLIVVGLFQLLTVPVASHMVARAAYRSGRIDREHLVFDEFGPGSRKRSDGRG